MSDEEVEDKDFDDIVREKEHKALLTELREIKKLLSERQPISVPEVNVQAPKVHIETNQDKVVTAVEALSKKIEDFLNPDKKEAKDKEWVFTVYRNPGTGTIKQIIAK